MNRAFLVLSLALATAAVAQEEETPIEFKPAIVMPTGVIEDREDALRYVSNAAVVLPFTPNRTKNFFPTGPDGEPQILTEISNQATVLLPGGVQKFMPYTIRRLTSHPGATRKEVTGEIHDGLNAELSKLHGSVLMTNSYQIDEHGALILDFDKCSFVPATPELWSDIMQRRGPKQPCPDIQRAEAICTVAIYHRYTTFSQPVKGQADAPWANTQNIVVHRGCVVDAYKGCTTGEQVMIITHSTPVPSALSPCTQENTDLPIYEFPLYLCHKATRVQGALFLTADDSIRIPERQIELWRHFGLIPHAPGIPTTEKKAPSLLKYAAMGHDTNVGKLLSIGTDANTRTVNGSTALHHAAATNQCKVARLLLQHGALIDMPMVARAGITPLLYAPNGSTALHLAAACGHVEMVRLLLEHGANPDIRDSYGNRPIDIEQVKYHPEIIAILSQHR